MAVTPDCWVNWQAIELLILDDWGLEAVNAEQRNALLEIMDDRYGKYSTVVVSQLPTEEWYASLGTTLWQMRSWTG